MAAAPVLSISWLLFLLAGGFGAGVPLGMPPLPEDPVLSAIAPEECLWYMSWSGTAEPDPQSTNEVERLLAEKEVRQFFARIDEVVQSAIKAGTSSDTQKAAAANAYPLLKTLFTRPAAVFVSKANVANNKLSVEGGMVVNLGDAASAARIKALLLRLEPDSKPLPKGEGDEWRPLRLPPEAPPVAWMVRDRYLVVGVGEGAGPAIVDRFARPAPEWLTELRQKLAVERVSMVSFLNVQGLVESFVPRPDQQVVAALGLADIQSLSNVTGLDAKGVVSKSLLRLSPEQDGLVSLWSGGEPLTKADLQGVPADVTFCVAARIDAAQLYEAGLKSLERVNPRLRRDYDQELQAAEDELGFSVEDDLIASLGDVWRIYNSPGDGGLLFTGITAVIDVKDRARLQKVCDTLVSVAAKQQRTAQEYGSRNYVTIKQAEFGGSTIYFLNVVGDEFPFAPAWAITDDKLIVSLFPQPIKGYLSREGQPSLAENTKVAAALESGPLVLGYQDTPALARTIYPFLPIGANLLCSELQRNGIKVDISMLPSLGSILPHLSPGVSSVRRTEDGLRTESHTSLPSGGGLAGSVPVAAALLLPAIHKLRSQAEQMTGSNNLKQIGLSLLNHESAHRAFPSRGIMGAGGKPLLSWRVQILPYLEQNYLYSQFKLDEPWDSEHNKKLLASMPPQYLAPGSRHSAGEGLTNYLAVVGENTIFPSGDERVTFSNIEDGTSLTIMVVEADDERAVPWTKPDDYVYDPDDPAAGLGGLRDGSFLAAFADGSVRAISRFVDKETLKAAFTRNGGEVYRPFEQ